MKKENDQYRAGSCDGISLACAAVAMGRSHRGSRLPGQPQTKAADTTAADTSAADTAADTTAASEAGSGKRRRNIDCWV